MTKFGLELSPEAEHGPPIRHDLRSITKGVMSGLFDESKCNQNGVGRDDEG
jgi:hypothetical protein